MIGSNGRKQMIISEVTIKTKSGQAVNVGPGDFALVRSQASNASPSFFPVRVSSVGEQGAVVSTVINGKGIEKNISLSEMIGYPSQDSARAEIKSTWPWHYDVLLTQQVGAPIVTEQAEETERWVFTKAQLKNPKGLRRDDELIALVTPDEPSEGVDVIVYRNGEVSNRFGDGTVGLPEEVYVAAQDEDKLFDEEEDDWADNWRDVIVDADGNFVRFADEESAQESRSALRRSLKLIEVDGMEDDYEEQDEDLPREMGTGKDFEDEEEEPEYEFEGPMFEEGDEESDTSDMTVDGSPLPSSSGNYNVQTSEESPVGPDTSDFLGMTDKDIDVGAEPLAVFDPGEAETKGAEGGFKPTGGSSMERSILRRAMRFQETDPWLRKADQLIESMEVREKGGLEYQPSAETEETPSDMKARKRNKAGKGSPRMKERLLRKRRMQELAQTQRVRGVQTDVVSRGGETIVTYRGTPVVVFDDSKIELNTGGWKTATTKTRMNQASNQYDLGYQVVQKGGEWFVKQVNGQTIPFEGNSLIINRGGMRERRSRRRPVREAGDLEYLDFAKIANAKDYSVGMDTRPFLNTLKKDTKLGDDSLGSNTGDTGSLGISVRDNSGGGGIIGGDDVDFSAPDIEAPDDESSEIDPLLPGADGTMGTDKDLSGPSSGSLPDEESSLPNLVQGVVQAVNRNLGAPPLAPATDDEGEIPKTDAAKVIAPKNTKLGAAPFSAKVDADKVPDTGANKVIAPANRELGAKSLEARKRAARRRRLERQRRRKEVE